MKQRIAFILIAALTLVVLCRAIAAADTYRCSNAPQAIRLTMEGGFDPSSNHLIPGANLDQGFTITLDAENPPCWLFFELTPSENSAAFFSYQIGEGWQQLPGYPHVYYRHVDTLEQPAVFDPLMNDCVHVHNSLTAQEMAKLVSTTGSPSISCSAFAIQSEGFTPELGWAQYKP